jgi:hypothetical protein
MNWRQIKESIDESIEDDAEIELLAIRAFEGTLDVQIGFAGCIQKDSDVLDVEYSDCQRN